MSYPMPFSLSEEERDSVGGLRSWSVVGLDIRGTRVVDMSQVLDLS